MAHLVDIVQPESTYEEGKHVESCTLLAGSSFVESCGKVRTRAYLECV